MTTRIADVIIPEVFNPYVVNRTTQLSALYQSGIVATSPEFDSLASQATQTIHLPFWNDLDGVSEVLSDTNPLVPGKITSGQDEAVIFRRGRAWASNDLAGALAGSDPAKAIGDLVASYWSREMQRITMLMLKGVFSSPSMENNVHDISAQTGDAANFTGTTFIDAVQKLGDAKEKLTAIVMHSATEASLAKQNLIQNVQPADGSPSVKTYMGKRVIVDDACPVENGIYTSYIFGEGAIALGNGSPVRFVPTETDRDSLVGDDYLINRKTFILHIRGVAFTKNTMAGSSPSDSEIALAANWNRVYDPKKIRVVQFKHKLA
ncbi:major capsid protein [Aneurinibacillus thermoaerophilus]|uniref:Phage major capsid protein, HK97 family n=1 Tax=Aneurinibacillus thermoaerophilus TaxID=143495 RepID=A0A1G8EN58_ANETH|nr:MULTISPECIES: major capsid protein [Aneurinibacillus]AMA72923.1 coat protein [Aneurinibacillus sp. XH2]MED0758661.1 major capsid protein [Aneurinibacillus thermoaerophilus]MED0761051.1 major capsid protein [Aneurinibacillus thermoaerophilus]SDH71344.1 phage major capsid protein, HK97 family [Aneurinibacillus thermoaerophilus]